jgi:ribosomal protein L22
MSAEQDKGAKDAAGETPAEPKATAKPAAAKAAAAKKPAAAKKAAAAKKPAAKKAEKKPAAEKAPAAKKPAEKPAAKKAAAKKPAAEKADAPSQPVAAKDAAKAPEAKKPAAKAAARPAKGAAPAPRRRVVLARARYVRTSARKARMVCGHLRGKSVEEARAILAFTPREVARDWSKLLESAVANAESNHELLQDDLIVREAYADEGPTIKRFRPRAMGRATPIRKRTSHLTITLTPRPEPGTNKRHG